MFVGLVLSVVEAREVSGSMMNRLNRRTFLAALIALGLASLAPLQARAAGPDPLPSWNDKEPVKKSILDFVAAVTKEGGPDYVKPAERIATFDNDGTLWIEQPLYNQFVLPSWLVNNSTTPAGFFTSPASA